jgi:hypothetical protein
MEKIMTIRHPRQAHSRLWRYHLNALGYATMSEHFIASAREVHKRCKFGDKPRRATVKKVLVAMENEGMFGLCT